MSDLPESWSRANIGAVIERTDQRVPGAKEEFVYVDIGSVNRETKTVRGASKIAGSNAPSRARKVIRTGDVVVSMTRPNLNAVALIDEDLDDQIASTGFEVLRSNELDPRWLYYLVRTEAFVGRMTDLVQGALYPAIRPRDIHAFEIPVAPLPEQKRIADKLEAVLGRVDACRARLARVPDLLKRFRQSVLAAATSGRLTADWREEQNGVEWRDTEFGALIADGPKNGLYKSSSCYGQGTRILRIDNFYSGRINVWSDLKRLDVTEIELRDFGLQVGDIVINRVNSMSHLGKSALVRDLPEPCVFESNMMRVRLDPTSITTGFGILVLTSPSGIAELQEKQNKQ